MTKQLSAKLGGGGKLTTNYWPTLRCYEHCQIIDITNYCSQKVKIMTLVRIQIFHGQVLAMYNGANPRVSIIMVMATGRCPTGYWWII